MTDSSERETWRTEEVAERMGVTAITVQRWCERGEIPGAKKIGRQWFVSIRALREFLHGEETEDGRGNDLPTQGRPLGGRDQPRPESQLLSRSDRSA